MEVSFSFVAVVRGYHIYKDIWDAEIDEELPCEREVGNRHDSFAVAVKKDATIVGHVPRYMSAICSIFIRRGGSIVCKVTGSGTYSADLPQGGMDVPCLLIFKSSDSECQKARKLISSSKDADISSINDEKNGIDDNRINIESTDTSQVKYEVKRSREVVDVIEVLSDVEIDRAPPAKKQNQTDNSERVVDIDIERIIFGERLVDLDINFAQKLLKAQFPRLQGLQSTLLQAKKVFLTAEQVQNKLQVVHCLERDHWIVATNVNCDNNFVKVYDSLYCAVDEATKLIVVNRFQTAGGQPPQIKVVRPQKQNGGKDCGVFAIAVATSIAFGHSLTVTFDQQRMRSHLAGCFKNKLLSVFP